MKNAIFLVASLSLLAACAINPEMAGDTGLSTCKMLKTPANCENAQGSGPSNPVVNFNKKSLVLAPHNVCAHKGTTLKFRITPSAKNENPPGSVTVIPKKGKDTWLHGTNTADNTEIEIKIPDNLPSNSDYDYTVVSVMNGVVSCVDPRIHVTN